MADGIAFSIVGKLAEYTVDPVLRQVKYLFFYNNNIKNLKKKIQELENRRNDVKLRVDAAKRNAEIIGKEVSAWLQEVDELKEKVNEILKGVASSEMRCLFNRCPNLKSRYLLSRRATKKTIEVDKLKVEGTFERVSSRPPPMQVLNLTSHEGFETRLSIKKKIKEALKDKNIGIIGICGMPGVGKTTMANEIVNEVKVEKLFEEVAFAVVSKDVDINKIQDQLAEALGLKIEEKITSMRAGLLHQRLEGNDDKNIIVILDDVWNEIDLGSIGIPSPHDHKWLKIMFTTRIEETCSKMEAQRTFEIKILDEKEGWQLFKDTAGISDDETDAELISIAKEVVDECGCLPLALVVVGKALKSNKVAHKWRDALRQLRSSSTNLDGMEKIVYKSIRLSYDYLAGNEEQDLLLLCSLFAEDESIPIENLVRYARGLELFKKTETLYETRDRAKTIVDNLKSCNLLQLGEKEDEVKLHDVIRDFCLKMAYEDKRGYLVNHTGLKEWPELDADELCSIISITFDELGQFPGGLKYQNVKLLRVICPKSEECIISEDFFKDMKELRVLELEGMRIQIPSSIELLTCLRTLCLIDCKICSQLSMIGSLKKLEILSFNNSFGDQSPIEFTNLCNLRSLDLRSQELSFPLLPGVFLGMKKLEELYLGSYIPIEDEDQRYIIEEEFSSLTSLRTFQISTFSRILMQILKTPCLENLENFQILGTTKPRGRIEPQYFTRSLSLQDGVDASILLQPTFNSLMKRTYHLYINADKVLKNVVSELDGDGFINLKTLILSSGDFEYLIDATNTIPSGTFGKLESLELTNLPKLIEICNGNLPSGVFKPPLFSNLMTIKMSDCDAIRSLFRESIAKCLVNLQSLDIYKCVMLEEVVSKDAQENEVTKACEMLEFPKLRVVALGNLSRFKSFTSQSNNGVVSQALFSRVHVPNMEELNVHNLDCIVKLLGKEMPITSLHKLTDMVVSDCAELLTIAESDSIKLLQNLEVLNVEKCNALKVLFDFEGIKVTNDDAEISVLGRLPSLRLDSLPELVHITRMVPKGICVFQNLINLDVTNCKSLKCLFSPSIVNSLVVLESLSILSCEALEEIIGREEKEANTSEIRNIVMDAKTPLNLHHFTQVVSMDAKRNEVIDMLEFPKLNELRLRNLSNFKSFKSESNNDGILQALFNKVDFPNMKELVVDNLDCIVKLLGKEMPIKSLHKLIKVWVQDCVKLLVIAESDSIQLLQNLEVLDVWKCNTLEVLFDFEGIKVTNDDAEISMLGRLDTLRLYSLPEFVHITRMVPKGICVFQNLTDLYVTDCKSLKCLFSPSIVNSLVALESLSIDNCEALEEIVGREEKEEENTSKTRNIVMDANTPSNLHHFTQVVSIDAKRNEVIDMREFPKLNRLVFRNLISFKRFRSESYNDGILRTLFNQVNFPNMEELNVLYLYRIVKLLGKKMPTTSLHNLRHMWVYGCVELLTIAESDSILLLQNLEDLDVFDCNALEVLFDFEGIKVDNDDSEISVLGQLTSLQLNLLSELVHITRMVPKGICVFQKLTNLRVENCMRLKYLFLPSMANYLVALEVLRVSNCESIKAIVGIEEEEEEEEEEEDASAIKKVEAMKTRIVFPKLDLLLLENLSSIQMFCSQNYELVFPLLKDLTIENCPMMTKLSPWPVSAPKLDISDLLGKAGNLAEEDQVGNK